MIITMQHCREIGYCAFGVRKFMQRHGLDFKKFLKVGLDEKHFLDTGDALALKLVEHANVGRK